MHEAQAIIERVRRVSPTLQRLDVAVDRRQAEIGPGQLLLARTTDSYDPYLRIPWVPVAREQGMVVIERPSHQSYTPGQIVSLLGPVGKPIPLSETIRALLLIAYQAAPTALLMLANTALARGGGVALALIGSAAYYPVETLPTEIEVIRAHDDLEWAERDRMLGWAEQVVAVAPAGFDLPAYTRLMDHVQRLRVEPADGYAYGLFHPPIPCGVGACQACLIHLRGGHEAAACMDGPAFDLKGVRLEGA